MKAFSDSNLILNDDGSVYHLSLKPGQVSNNIIVVGDPGRVHRVSRHFDGVEFEMNKREFITHTGFYNNKRITVLSSGMGTDNIEILMIELDALFNIDLKNKIPKVEHSPFNIVRIGTSGGIQEAIEPGTPVVASYGVGLDGLMQYYDLAQDELERSVSNELQIRLEHPFRPYCVKGSEALKQQLAFDIMAGNTVTTPGFYAPQGRSLRIETRHDKLLDTLTYFNHEDFWLSNFEMETSALYAFARMLGHQAIAINTVLANRQLGTFSKDPYKPIDEVIKKVLDRI